MQDWQIRLPPIAVVSQPAARQIGRPSNRCTGGGVNTNRAGFQPGLGQELRVDQQRQLTRRPSILQPSGSR